MQQMNVIASGTDPETTNHIHQIRPAFPTSSDLERPYSPSPSTNASNASAPLAELKLKAKESILAKKAQVNRSSPQGLEGRAMQNKKGAFVKNEALAQSHHLETPNESNLPDSFKTENGSAVGTTSKLNLSNTANPAKPSAKSLWKTPIQFESSNNVGHSTVANPSGVKASSLELEDLLAEGRAAAEKKPRAIGEAPMLSTAVDRMTKEYLANESSYLENPQKVMQKYYEAAKTDGKTADRIYAEAEIPTTGATISSPCTSINPRLSNKEAAIFNRLDDEENVPRNTERSILSCQKKHSDVNGGSEERESMATPTKMSQYHLEVTQVNAHADMTEADSEDRSSTVHGTTGTRAILSQGDNNPPLSSGPSSTLRPVVDQIGTASQKQDISDDVEEWLLMTGFYDKPYRQKVLSRRRRMRAIEEERMQLLLEEQADQAERSHMARSQSVMPANTILASPFLNRPASSAAMPAPLPPPAQDLGLHIKNAALENSTEMKHVKTSEAPVKTNTLKRRKDSSDMTNMGEDQSRKLKRTEQSDQATHAMGVDEVNSGAVTVHQPPPTSPARTRPESRIIATNGHKPSLDQRRWADSEPHRVRKHKSHELIPDKPRTYDSYRRVAQDNRDSRTLGSEQRLSRPTSDEVRRRGDYEGSDYRSSRYEEQVEFRRNSIDDDNSSRRSGINLRVEDVRYFLIKSWNYENIETAQRECTWCTQTKNEEQFLEAFKRSRHVILIFSANNSHAFQGYARMESVPGEPNVPDPSWRKNLHWPTTQPFRIKWLVKGDIPYRVAGKLKNPLNDDTPVFVGRDGQEIPDRIALELCEAIEQDANKYVRTKHYRSLDY